MTGIEMLRELALDIDGNVKVEWFVAGYDERSRWKGHTLAHELDWIADQIEREQRERYDALNDENERLRDMLNVVSYHLGMGEDVHYYSEYNYDECQHSVLRAIDERLMPDGYEWPRYEDGNPLLLGDKFVAKDGDIRRALSILIVKGYLTIACYDAPAQTMPYGERVKRPQVLAADGEPLEVGQTVWDTNGDELQVLSIEDDQERHVTCHYEGIDGIKANGWWLPHTLTHQRPVLDADGVPIEVGDTVWMTGEPDYGPFTVTNITTKHAWHVYGTSEKDDDLDMPPSELTHTKPEPPDSWERIEEDAQLNPDDYWMHHSGSGEERESAALAMARDIMHRCIALAGVSE